MESGSTFPPAPCPELCGGCGWYLIEESQRQSVPCLELRRARGEDRGGQCTIELMHFFLGLSIFIFSYALPHQTRT